MPGPSALVYVVGRLAIGVAVGLAFLLAIAAWAGIVFAAGVAFRGDVVLAFLFALVAFACAVLAFLALLVADWIWGLYGDAGGSR